MQLQLCLLKLNHLYSSSTLANEKVLLVLLLSGVDKFTRDILSIKLMAVICTSCSVAAPNPMVIHKSASTHCKKRPSGTLVIMMSSTEHNHISVNSGLQIRLPSTRTKVSYSSSFINWASRKCYFFSPLNVV